MPQVHCDDPPVKAPPSEAACQKMLSTTPVSRRGRLFHGKQSPHVANEVVLPVIYTGEFSSSRFSASAPNLYRTLMSGD